MAINISTTQVEVARFAGALYGLALDNATMTVVLNAVNANGANGLNTVLNNVFQSDFGSATDASVAATLTTNLGLTGTVATEAQTYIAGVLAGTAANAKGAAVLNILNLFAGLTSDATFGTAATAWENKVSNSVQYSQNTSYTSNASIGTISSTPVGQTFTLTSGIDSFTGGSGGYNTFNATDSASGNAATFTSLDNLNGGGGPGNVLNITYGTQAINTGAVAGATVTGIQTANMVESKAATALTANTSTGWTGLTALNTTNLDGATTDTAASTTSVGATSTTGSIAVQGGLNVTATTAGGAVTIGSTTAPTGTITVTNTGTAGTIKVDGGTAVTISNSGSGTVTVDANTASTGNIAITDSASLIGSTIAVGTATVAPTGTITVTNTTALTAAGAGNTITTYGGTTVNITDNISDGSALAKAIATNTAQAATTLTGGAVTVHGSSTTTSVTVGQTAAATAHAYVKAVAAVASVATVTAVTAAPGVDAVAAVAHVAPVTGVTGHAGVLGVKDGNVTVSDVNSASTSKAGTITSVTVNNYGTVTVNDNALTTLNATGGGNITVNSGSLTSPTNKTLGLNLNGVTGTFSNTGNVYTTLNANVSGTGGSTLSSITDSSLTTLNVSGSQVLSVTTVPSTLTTIAVSGSAGFTGDVHALGATLTSFTSTSSGVVTATVDDTTQTFTGGSGQDIITITGDATKAIKAGSATNNEIVLNAAATTFTAAKTVANVTGFTTLGVNTASTGSYDLGVLTGFNSIDVQNTGAGNLTFTNVVKSSPLAIDAAAGAGTITYQTADTTGSSDTLSLTLGQSANSSAITVPSLTLEDANLVGIGTVTLASNDSTAGAVNTITTLVDNGLSSLTVNGNAGLTIGTLNEATTAATSFTLANNETGTAATGVTITSFTDASLGNLTFSGAGATFITTLTDASGVINIANNDSGGVTIGTLADAGATGALYLNLGISGSGSTTLTTLTNSNATTTSMTVTDSASGNAKISTVTANTHIVTETFNNTGSGKLTVSNDLNSAVTSLTLKGNVAFNNTTGHANSPTGTAFTAGVNADAATTGVTVTAGTDNAHLNLGFAGAASGKTDSITVGNGNDFINDLSTAGTVNVTVGTGSNLVSFGTGTTDTSGAYTLTLGTHSSSTGIDEVAVGTAGTAFASTPNLVVTGAAVGDKILLAGDTNAVALVGTGLTGGAGTITNTSLSAATSISSAVSTLETTVAATAEHIAVGVYGGNTFIVEANATAAAAGTNTTVIELIGSHTLSATGSTAIHLLTVAS
ncbi:MAG: S-layer family protein [Betaproteobacteria bacterium]|nr:S-layer family protein [Betaproteobacteria bacterium]